MILLPLADLDRLNQYIDEKLASFVKRHRDERFDRVVATSSTPAALVCAANRIPRAERDSADRMACEHCTDSALIQPA